MTVTEHPGRSSGNIPGKHPPSSQRNRLLAGTQGSPCNRPGLRYLNYSFKWYEIKFISDRIFSIEKKRKPQTLEEALAQLEAAEEKIRNQTYIINWQEAVYKKCRPLEPLIVQHIKSGCTMHMDETTVKVLEYEGDVETADGKPRSKSYMWLASGGPKGKPAVVFRYNKSRSGTNASEFINGFSGYCFMYTLIENAKLSGLVPYDYLRCLFEQAADLDENSDWSKLLPWNIKITPWKDLDQW